MKPTDLLLFVCLAFVVSGCGQSPPLEPSAAQSGIDPVHLTDANFRTEVIESDVPVLVDMWAPWCQPCITMTPMIRELASELSGEVKVAELNIEQNPFIEGKYNIDKYPMLLIFIDGKEVERLIGLKSKDDLEEALWPTRVSKRERSND